LQVNDAQTFGDTSGSDIDYSRDSYDHERFRLDFRTGLEKDGGPMGSELVWRLQHVWPKDTPDLTEVNLSGVDDDEARRLVAQVEDVKRAFEHFVEEDVVPHISRQPTRVGVVETVRLFTSESSMNTDYLLLLSGILEGNGGVLDQIAESYTITTAEGLGQFAELATYDLSKSSK